MINREKSYVMFSSNARNNFRNLMLQALELGPEAKVGSTKDYQHILVGLGKGDLPI
jgi:hypothetical protein